MTAPLSQNPGPDQPPPPPAQSIAKTHPVLMMTVIGLGIAILLVVALMVGLTIRQMTGRSSGPKPQQAVQSVPQPAAAANYNTMVVREGTTIADARIDGGFLILRTAGDEADEVMTFDPKTGQLLARITLKKSDAQ